VTDSCAWGCPSFLFLDAGDDAEALRLFRLDEFIKAFNLKLISRRTTGARYRVHRDMDQSSRDPALLDPLTRTGSGRTFPCQRREKCGRNFGLSRSSKWTLSCATITNGMCQLRSVLVQRTEKYPSQPTSAQRCRSVKEKKSF